ncbi:unnamed protein product, partial [Cylicostephanus goldi]
MEFDEHMRELLERNRNFVKDLIQQNPWLRPAAYLLAAILLLICLGFRALPIACCLCSTFLGVSIAMWIANDSNGRFLYALVQVWISSNSMKKAELKEVTNLEEERKPSSRRELKVPVCVNDAAESLLDQLIDTYVNNWYESGISRDRDFLNEIRYQIRFACSQLVTIGMKLDLPTIIAEDVVPVASLHMHRIMKFEDQLADKALPRSLMESAICENLSDLHFCLGSRQNELDYLRQ